MNLHYFVTKNNVLKVDFFFFLVAGVLFEDVELNLLFGAITDSIINNLLEAYIRPVYMPR